MRYVVPAFAVVLALLCLLGWQRLALREAPVARLELKVEANDPPEIKGRIPGEYILRADGQPADLPGSFTRFRGPHGDAVYPSELTFATDWEAEPPEEMWNAQAGLGHSGFAVADGKVYIQDYDIGCVIRDGEAQFHDYDPEEETVSHLILFRQSDHLVELEAFIRGYADFTPADREFLVESKLRGEMDVSDDTVAIYRGAFNGYGAGGEDLSLQTVPVPAFLRAPVPRALAFDSSKRMAVNALVWLWERDSGETVERIYGHEDMVRCLSLADGEEIWRNCYHEKVAPIHGVSRATPSIEDGKLIALGPMGLLVCLDAVTGKRIWAKDIRKEYGSKIPTWWSAQSPLIEPKPTQPDQWMVVLAPCGTPNGVVPKKIMVALDLATGAYIWGADNTYDWPLSHATPIPYELDGEPTYLYCAHGGIVCVDATRGSVLFASDLWQVNTATVTVPLDCDDGRIFVSGGYRSGSKMLQVVKNDSGLYAVEELWSLRASPRGFESEQHGPIYDDGVIYGVNTAGGSLVCLDPATGEQLWQTSRRDHSFGLGPFFKTGDLIFALEEKGRRGKWLPRLKCFRVSPEAFEFFGAFEVTRDQNAWAVMSLVGDRLLLRDQAYIQCLRLPTTGGE